MSYEIDDTLSPFVPKVEFKLIPIKNLVSNQDYQRGLSENHILKAAENFDVRQINPVKVSHRDGQYYVINGQHTIEIVALVSNSRETPVWCMIYEEELSYQTEAQIFADQQKYVKALIPIETFKAHLEAGNEKQLTIQQIVHSYDLEIGSTNNNTATICAVSALEYIYDKYGVHTLDRTIRMCVATWEGEANTIKKIRTIDNRELADITVDSVIDHLEKSLKTIPAGAENATSYHKTVVGILELLFYPHLSNPKIENEIHEGRKRIDITFDNCAESGFFYLLSNDIPCRYIMVECKNYSQDIKNPELDQLSGRFSPRRGQVGIAACRTIEDNDQLMKRCIDTYKDSRGLIIPLCDDDLLTMLEIYREKGVDGCEELLGDKRRSICLS